MSLLRRAFAREAYECTEKTANFGLNGSLAHRALPALRQLVDDLTRFLPSWPGFVWGWVLHSTALQGR